MARAPRRTVLALAAAALTVACQAKPSTPDARGRGAFLSYNCQQCHRVGGRGGTTGPDLTFVGFRKSEAFLELWLKDPAAWQPGTQMPNFHFNDATRRDLAAYMATLKGGDLPSPKPWDSADHKADPVKRGAEIYARAGCLTCHGRGGRGGYANNNVAGGKVPGLQKAWEGFSRAELVDRIARGRVPDKEDPKGPDPLLRMPAWSEVLSPDEIEAVADYVLSLKPKGARPSSDW